MLDVVIVGGGPAGLAAAVYLARQKLAFALLTKDLGGQVLLSSDVENYLGFHLLDGTRLVAQFQTHIADYQQTFALKQAEPVVGVDKINGGFAVKTARAGYQTKTVLIASGTTHRELDVPGEKEFYGHGLSYCAHCDAPLFKDKVVSVVGGGNSALDAALLAEKYARVVFMVTLNPELQGDDIMQKTVASSGRIRVFRNTRVTRVIGGQLVTGLEIEGMPEGCRILPTDGILVEIGLRPITDFIGLVDKDRRGQIIVDKNNQTSVEGIWAAGDVTDIPQKQIAVAVGEGSKAALSIITYLQTHA